MKFSKKVVQDFNIKYLTANMEVRCWEDAIVNGVKEDDDNPTIPKRENDCWNITIDVDKGQIVDWPKGVTAKTHYKVCDAGTYKIYTVNNDWQPIAEINGYVPSMLSNGGYGDYVILDINEDGFIKDWNPDLSCFEEEEEEYY